jgi:golgi apyrase
MGGASAQVAFAPNETESSRHANDLILLRLRTLDGNEKEYRVFVSTWLGYGANVARKRYVETLASKVGDTTLRDPCLPKGLQLPLENSDKTILGTGSLADCLNLQVPILAKDIDCHDEPCLFGGVHAPAIDFDVNHFIGVSEYWHTTNDIFEMGGAYDYATYSGKVEEFCSREWDSIVKDLKRQKWGKKITEENSKLVCFKAAWMMNVLHDGFGIPRLTREFTNPPSSSHNSTQDFIDSAKTHGFLDPFTSVDKIDGTEVTWTLGKVVLFSSSTVPTGTSLAVDTPSSMVGFGPNTDRLYLDGEFYSQTGEVLPHSGPLSRLTTSFAVGNRLPGLLLFLTLICLAGWLIMGKDRRNRVLLLRRWFRRRRKVMGATGMYERLELGQEDDLEQDDSVGGRTWALHELKPKEGALSPFRDVVATSSVGRSESRERLSRPGSRSGRL